MFCVVGLFECLMCSNGYQTHAAHSLLIHSSSGLKLHDLYKCGHPTPQPMPAQNRPNLTNSTAHLAAQVIKHK